MYNVDCNHTDIMRVFFPAVGISLSLAVLRITGGAPGAAARAPTEDVRGVIVYAHGLQVLLGARGGRGVSHG